MPAGCLGNVTDIDERLQLVLEILLHDLLEGGTPRVLAGTESNVCYQVIVPIDGMFRFTDRCCHYDVPLDDDDLIGQDQGQVTERAVGQLTCFVEFPNRWLDTLDALLGALFVLTFVFGALLLPNWLYSASMETFRYVVQLDKVITA